MSTLEPCHWSNLKHMADSPAHYRASLVESHDSASMALGRALHCLLLGGDFVVWEEKMGRRFGKVWDAFKLANEGREIFREQDLALAQQIAASVRLHPEAVSLLMGSKEVEIDWTWLGRSCRSHLDVLGTLDWIADLKSTRCAHPDRFRWQAFKLGYHAQMAFYQDAAKFLGLDRPKAFLVAVETAAPFDVTVLSLSPEDLEEGRKLNRLWMERLLQCEAADFWPGYTQAVVPMNVRGMMGAEEPVTLIMPNGDEVAA